LFISAKIRALKTTNKPLVPESLIWHLSLQLGTICPACLSLTLFFPSAAVFNLASSIWSIDIQQPLVTLIIRAKKSYVAYYKAPKPPKGKRGRRPKYGKKVKLFDLFGQLHLFSKVKCEVYGKIEEISIMTLNLMWKPTGCMIRFVFAVTSRGPIVLMCSDLGQDPLSALQLYCVRIRVETMFDMLKNLIGAFNYRFWSKHMPQHSRKPKKNKDLKQPCPQAIAKVELCWQAYERFALLGSIALGLLQIISLKDTDNVWSNFDAYLRTRSRQLPSERTVKYVVARLLINNLLTFAPTAIIREIRKRYFAAKTPRQKGFSPK
jgi:hypothetical protein